MPGSAWISAHRSALVIFDGLFRLVRVRDASDYAEMSRALEPLIQLARKRGAHILATHHSPKMERGGGDDVLGSTAIFGSVDTLLTIRRARDGARTLSTDQRYGENLAETVLILEKESGRTVLGLSREDVTLQEIRVAILDVLRAASDALTEEEILAKVQGATGSKRTALRSLLEGNAIERTGHGRRGSPYGYAFPSSPEADSISRSLVPTVGMERENEKRESAA